MDTSITRKIESYRVSAKMEETLIEQCKFLCDGARMQVVLIKLLN